MASEKLFKDIPAFPDDIPAMPMATISLAGLRSGDADTARQVLTAAQELGFFLLDLREDEEGKVLMEEIDRLFGIAKESLNLPDHVRQQYQNDPPRNLVGFKPIGQGRIENGGPDRMIAVDISQDGLMGTIPLQPLPPCIHDELPLFKSYLKHDQDIVAMISTALATQLSLPSDTFTSCQRPDKPSGSVVRMIKSPAYTDPKEDLQTALVQHTDIGSVTLLANVVGGLQILPPGAATTDDSAWRYVRPQPGHLIVNLGDSMVQWTGGVLRSNVHRIRYAPGQQHLVDRYSVVYLTRPEREARMTSKVPGFAIKGMEERNLTAKEWELEKVKMVMTKGICSMESQGGNGIKV